MKTFEEIVAYFNSMDKKTTEFDFDRDFLPGLSIFDSLSDLIKQDNLHEKERGILNDFLGRMKEKAIAILKQQNNISSSKSEIDKIRYGEYQSLLEMISSVYSKHSCELTCLNHAGHDESFKIYPLLNKKGLKCSVALPLKLTADYQIHLVFLGTIDFASLWADLDFGGPGQETIRRHEQQLLEMLNQLLQQLKEIHPHATFRLRMAGHSLGGALAKGFALTLLRALAIQRNSAEEIIEQITNALREADQPIPRKALHSLKLQLIQDEINFNKYKDLMEIKDLTVYALGSPGISRTTDWHATLLTYFHAPELLKMYHHYHAEDSITQFGESEFLSGKYILPRIAVNKAIEYTTVITPKEIENAIPLPFPGVTKRVMAAHCKQVGVEKDIVQTRIVDLIDSKVLEKKEFSTIHRALYRAGFSFFKTLTTNIPRIVRYTSYQTIPESNIDLPILRAHEFSSVEIEIPRSEPIQIPHVSDCIEEDSEMVFGSSTAKSFFHELGLF